MVTNGELADVCADRFDHTGAIGHRDASIGRRHLPEHDAQIMEIERAGVQTYPDLPVCGLARIGQFDQFQCVETSRMREANSAHGEVLK
ncbi:hypothetical protein XVE_5031 [Xanthomonas vesicatoria ATCC 35937]|uniref:Uncharacterized protein n=1 Tax=Xanthomonas vesicatoria ATCC 35937 TaxID=925775 RepID=F0BL59_9XANT|nr:hypothetical protein XVE_5031 [Xanthomonas vesicatoria ATCC 35937]